MALGRYGEMSQILQESIDRYDDGYYKKKLDQGLEYQDVVTSALYQRGIIVVAYSSQRFQIEQGENMLGAEIKRDDKFRQTGNLYIETSEKSHPSNSEYIPSGIYRNDNSWLFVIGDEKTIYIFSTKYLRLLEKQYTKKITPTSNGYVMPLADAEKYCLRRIDLHS